MWAINTYTLCYLLLLVSTVPAPAAALLPSTALEIQSNQPLALQTPSPASALFAPLPPKPPKPPLPPRPPAPIPICFDPDQKGGLPPVVKDCEMAIEYILHIYPPGPMVPQNFSRTGADGTHRFPEAIEIKNCQILISSRFRAPGIWDMIRYVDVAIGAQEVLKVCVPQSKTGLGGTVGLGNKGSYVAVNGLYARDYGSVSEDGNETNATSMAMGTAVKNSLLTAVSGLAQGKEMDDDDEKLSMT